MTRRATLTAIVVIALAIPIYLLEFNGRRDGLPEPIGPTPTPTSIPTHRPVVLPGVNVYPIEFPGIDIDVPPQLVFLDASYGWAYFNSCHGTPDAVDCRHKLGRTIDGGRTWKTVHLPEIEQTPYLYAHVTSPRVFFLYGVGRGFWITHNYGEDFVWYPVTVIPIEARRVYDGSFFLRCPGQYGFGSGDDGPKGGCPERLLINVDSGQYVEQQPPWRGPTAELHNGHDGRLWLRDGSRFAVSTDQSLTWTVLPDLPAANLVLSADGSQAGAYNAEGMWRFVDEQWRREQIPAGLAGVSNPVLLNNGGWCVAVETADAGVIRDGRFTPIREVENDANGSCRQLPDGTLMLGSIQHHGFYMGSVGEPGREWAFVAY